jgi:hypothetical protein
MVDGPACNYRYDPLVANFPDDTPDFILEAAANRLV